MATPSQTPAGTLAQKLLKGVTKLQGHPDELTQRMHTAATDAINGVTSALNGVMDFSNKTVAVVTKPLQAARLLLTGSGPSPTFSAATSNALGPKASASDIANASAVPMQLSTPSKTSGAVYTAWNKGSLLGLMVGYDFAAGGGVIRQVTGDPLYLFTNNVVLTATFQNGNVTFASNANAVNFTASNQLAGAIAQIGTGNRISDVNMPLQVGRYSGAAQTAYIGANAGNSYGVIFGYDTTGVGGGGVGGYIRQVTSDPFLICIGNTTVAAKFTTTGTTLTSPVQSTSGWMAPVGPYALANMVTASAVTAMTYGDWGTTTFSGTTYGFVPTRSGNIIGLSGRVSSTSAATHTLGIYANGTLIVSIASASVAANTPSTVSGTFTLAQNYTFTSGQVLEIRYTCSATSTCMATATMMLSFAG